MTTLELANCKHETQSTELDRLEMVGGNLYLVSKDLSSIWSSDDQKSNAIRFLFGKVFVFASRKFDVLAFALIHVLAWALRGPS